MGAVERPGVRANGDFTRLWVANTTSSFGTAVTMVALPIVALVALDATPFEVGLVSSAGLLAWLVLGLPAGVWVERTVRRPLLIACDLVRAVVIVSIPVAALFDVVSMVQLVLVALVVGVATVLSDIAVQSYLPAVVEREQLLSGNSRLQASHAAAQTAGPALGGALVQLLGATFSLLADVVSYLASALLLSRVRKRETPVRSGERRRMLPQVKEGIRYVWADPVFRPLMLVATSLNLFGSGFDTLLVPFLLRDLHLAPAGIGGMLAIAGLGALVGATTGPLVARKLGAARALAVVAVAGPLLGLLVPVAQGGPGLVLFAVGLFGREAGIAVVSLLARTFRQQTAPPELLSRITATIKFVSWGVLPIGAFAGGVLGQVMGPRAAMGVLCGLLLVLTPLPIFAMSVRKLQELLDAGATGAVGGART